MATVENGTLQGIVQVNRPALHPVTVTVELFVSFGADIDKKEPI